ncbi:hypothetical protein GCM10027418_12290 [Mariniluteicoccus endophyticus]
MGWLRDMIGWPSPDGPAEPAADEPAAVAADDERLVAATVGWLVDMGLEPRQIPHARHFVAELDALRAEPERTVLRGGALGDDVWSHQLWVDHEMVADDDSYPSLVRRLAHATGRTAALGEVTSQLDHCVGTGTLDFVLDGREVHHDITLDRDWIDPLVLVELTMGDFCPDGREVVTAREGDLGGHWWVWSDKADEFRGRLRLG